VGLTAVESVSIDEDECRRRIALVFPPCCHPTSPPLGIACIKAFLAERLPYLDPRCFDLNLACYGQALAWMKSGRLKLSLYGWSSERTWEQVARTAAFFKGDPVSTGFFDLKVYQHHANLLLSFEQILNGFLAEMGRRELFGQSRPEALSGFWAELVEPVVEFRPEWVGLSLLFRQQLYPALVLAKTLKHRLPGVKTVFGGASLGVEEGLDVLIRRTSKVRIGEQWFDFEPWRYVDSVIRGEGETALVSLLSAERYCGGGAPDVMSQAIHRRIDVTRADAVSSLDSLPLPDFEELSPHAYWSPRPVLPYLTSRGCFWRKCAFCTHHHSYASYRERSVERCLDDLAWLGTRHGVLDFHLYDEMLYPRRLVRLAEGIRVRGLGFHFAAYAKPTTDFDREHLRLAFRGGCRLLMWGVESGNQRVLDLMRKGTRVETMEGVLQEAHLAGIWNMVFILFGFPSETESEFADTVQFLNRNRQHIQALSKSHFVLTGGSAVFRCPAEFGIEEIWQEPDQRDPLSVVHKYRVSRGLDPETAASLYRRHAETFRAAGLSPRFGVYRDHLLLYAACARGLEVGEGSNGGGMRHESG